MQRPNSMPICCGSETVWVDNVPSKEYCYCRDCKHEVDPDTGCKDCVTTRWPKHLRDAVVGVDHGQDPVHAYRLAKAQQVAVNAALSSPTLLQPRKGIAGIVPSTGGLASSLPPKVFPNVNTNPGGHQVHIHTSNCVTCGMTRSEAASRGYPPCHGPAEMAGRRDGIHALHQHDWDQSGAPMSHKDCTRCAANTAMFDMNGNGPHCAATAPIVAKPVASAPKIPYDTHDWDHVTGQCRDCYVAQSLANFPSFGAGPACPGKTGRP